jgi:hypothetical protein
MMALSGVQLVRHAGQELALVLARCLQLAALVLDFAKQPRVLDGQGRLRGNGLEQFNLYFQFPRGAIEVISAQHTR